MFRKRLRARALAFVVLLFAANGQSADDPLPPAAKKVVDYTQDVQPILTKRCFECHGAAKQRGGLRLDTAAGLRNGGKSGEVVVNGKSADSPLIHHVGAVGDAARMPPKGDPLTAEQIGLLRAWIDQGAKVPAAAGKSASAGSGWALIPLQRPAIPATHVDYRQWVRNPVDAFVVQKLLA